MSEAPSPARTPPRDESGRGSVFLGAAVLAAAGLVYVPGGLLLGAVLGSGFQLDPTWPWLASLVGNGLAAVMFTSGGALLALLCAAGASMAVARSPYAPLACAIAGLALLCTANLPLALVAFGLAYAATPQPVAVGATPAAG